jgi:hypothetical protein
MAIICIAILVFLGISFLGERIAAAGNTAGKQQSAEQFEKTLLKALEIERQILRDDHYARLQAWERMKRITGDAEKRI